MRNLILVVLLSFGCANAEARKKWYVKDVAAEKRVWRYCHESKDGPDLHNKGLCYISQKCRKTIFNNEKCKNVPLFCAWGDIECMEKNKWPQVRKGGDS